MNAYEWYDNYFCKKCKKQVHESHNTPKHNCKEIDEYNATGHAIKVIDQATTIFMIAFFIFCIVFIWWIIKINS